MVASVAAGKTLFKDAGKILGENAGSVVLYCQDYGIFPFFCIKTDYGSLGTIFYAVQDELVDDENDPFFVGVNFFMTGDLSPNVVLN